MPYAHAFSQSIPHSAVQTVENTGTVPRFKRQVTDFEVTAMYPVHAPEQGFDGNDTVAESRPDILDEFDTVLCAEAIDCDGAMTVVDDPETLLDYNPFSDEASPSLVADAEAVFASLRRHEREVPRDLQDFAYHVASTQPPVPAYQATWLERGREFMERGSEALKQFASASYEYMRRGSQRLLRFGLRLREKWAARQA